MPSLASYASLLTSQVSPTRHLELSRAINRLSEAILRGDTTTGVLQSLVDISGPALQVDRALIVDVQFAAGVSVGMCEWLQPGRNVAPTKAVYPIRLFDSAYREMARTNAPLESSRTAPHPLLLKDRADRIVHGQMSVQRLLWYPFLQRPDGYYLLVFDHVTRDRRWSADELEFVETVAGQVGLAIMKLDLLWVREQAEAELRKSETRFRLLYDHTPSMFFTVDRAQIIRTVNRFAIEHLGYREDELVNERFLRRVHAYDQLEVARYLAARFDDPGVARTLTFRKIHKRETTVWVRATTRVMSGADGATAFVVCEDVTQSRAYEEAARRSDDLRRQAEEEARIRREELAHALRVTTLGELTASLAHELNQPLTAIGVNARAGRRLLQSKARHNIDEVLVDINNDAARAVEIINRLRTMLRKSELERRPLDLNQLVSGVATLVRRDLDHAGGTLQLALAADLPVVAGDAIQLQQVTLNLLLNACDALTALPDGQRELVVSTRRAGDGLVGIDVRDNGVGMPESELARVFEPFVTTKAQGLGLGLSISRSIVEAHGGRIWATRNDDHGITLHVVLPE